MLKTLSIFVARRVRDALNRTIERLEADLDDKKAKDGPRLNLGPTGVTYGPVEPGPRPDGIAFGSVHGPVETGPGFGSVYGPPDVTLTPPG